MNGNDDFTIDRSYVTKSNRFKIVGKRFFNRVVNMWNSLPAHVIDSNIIEMFKRRLLKYLETNHRHIFLTYIDLTGTAIVDVDFIRL